MTNRKEEKIAEQNTLKMHKIMRKYDKIKGTYVHSEKAEEYLQEKMPIIKSLMTKAHLDKIIFKGYRYRSYHNDEYDFEIDYKTADSALTWAIRSDQFDLVKDFLDLGADFSKLNKVRSINNYCIGAQNTALREASKEMLTFLFDYGVEFDEYHTRMLKKWNQYPEQKEVVQQPKPKAQTKKVNLENEDDLSH